MPQTHSEQQIALHADTMAGRYFIVMSELGKPWLTLSVHKLNATWTNRRGQRVSVSSATDAFTQSGQLSYNKHHMIYHWKVKKFPKCFMSIKVIQS